ncbi:MAG: hypothetical protein AB7F40_12135 [Victivallaceae bacterium]
MSNNTIVVACNANYFWGAFLFVASLRKCGMEEPVLVFQTGFTPKDKAALEKLGGVKFVSAGESKKNMTCRKPEAMLHADTEYITWCDCDAFFEGNCSEWLAPAEPGGIHVRLRSEADNGATFSRAGLYAPGEKPGPIPKVMLDTWRRDVGELEESRLPACVSACFLSVHRSRRFFLERWRDQMAKVLPDADHGVVDAATRAYFQLDESVLNSLLCFMKDAPEVGQFMLDRVPGRRFVHFVTYPKPWQWWSPASLRAHDRVMELVRWCRERGLIDRPLPFPLNPRYARLHRPLARLAILWRIRRKLSGIMR